MPEQTVLVTGATGFLGRLLVGRLITEGYRITAIGCKSAISIFDPAVEYIQVDMTSGEQAREALKPWRWNAVINLAGPVVREEGTWQESYPFIRNHLAIALNLCMCLPERWEGRCIHTSSMSVYGTPQRLSVDEYHQRLPLNCYGIAKALAEEVFESWHGRYLNNYWLMRFPGLFSKERRSGALYNFISAAYRGKPLVVSASKPTPWDILHVSDAVEALTRALRIDSHDSGPINISYGEAVELKVIARLIIEITQSKSEVQNLHDIYHPVFQMDISRARQLLNWPPYTLRQRLKQLCADIASKAGKKDVA